jgi:hypothetical protein
MDDRTTIDILSGIHIKMGALLQETGQALEFIRSKTPDKERDFNDEYNEASRRG